MAEHVTVWRMKVVPGKGDELAELLHNEPPDLDRLSAAGWVATIIGRRKEHPDELWGTVTWDTSDNYYANADDPQQHAWYTRLRALLTEDPEWFDCDLVSEERA